MEVIKTAIEGAVILVVVPIECLQENRKLIESKRNQEVAYLIFFSFYCLFQLISFNLLRNNQ